MAQALEISDDALKLMVAEHGVRGTARLLGMDERQTMAFRQRAVRGKWLADPAIAAIRENRVMISPANVAKPIVSTVSPQQAVASEIAALGSKTRLSLARGIAKAGEHIESLAGPDIVAQASDIKSVAQTADLVHGWKDAAPQVKIRLDVLNASSETVADATQEVESEVIADWPEADPLDEY